MEYDVAFNPVAKLWVVWRITRFSAVIVKTFKTEAGARRWVKKQG